MRRIVPALAFVALCHLAYVAVSADDPLGVELLTVAAALGFVVNWLFAAGTPLAYGLSQTWSLSVEEQFYLCWPVLLALVLRRPRPGRALVVVVAAGVVAAIAVRSILTATGSPWGQVYVRTDARLDALLLGAGLAYAFHRGWTPPSWTRAVGWAGALLVMVLAALVHREDDWLSYGGYTLVALATACVIASVLDGQGLLARLLATEPLRRLGVVSYTVYLWHFPVFLATERHLGARPVVVRVVVAYAVTAAATLVSRRYVEAPFLRPRAD